MGRYQHSGGGRYRPRDVTGGMRASMAAKEAAERAIRQRLLALKAEVAAGTEDTPAQPDGRTDQAKG